jgi:hypothetical protein
MPPLGRRTLSVVLIILVVSLLFRPSSAHVERSIEHYTTVLGFSKHWVYPEKNPDFASITNGKVEIFLAQGEQGSPGTWVYYNVGDVDALHKQYTGKKADIMKAPKNMPWNMREMLVRDLDGHVLRIGQNLPPTTKEGL